MKCLDQGTFRSRSWSAHTIAGLIKLFLRSLPTRLLSAVPRKRLLDPRVRAEPRRAAALLREEGGGGGGGGGGAGTAGQREAIPEPARSVLRWLVSLMAEVVLRRRRNGMTALDISVVLIPQMLAIIDMRIAEHGVDHAVDRGIESSELAVDWLRAAVVAEAASKRKKRKAAEEKKRKAAAEEASEGSEAAAKQQEAAEAAAAAATKAEAEQETLKVQQDGALLLDAPAAADDDDEEEEEEEEEERPRAAAPISVTIETTGPLGILMATRSDGNPGTEVERVGGAAAATGKVSPGLVLLSVNDADCAGLSYKATMAVLKAATRPITLCFQAPPAAGGGGAAAAAATAAAAAATAAAAAAAVAPAAAATVAVAAVAEGEDAAQDALAAPVLAMPTIEVEEEEAAKEQGGQPPPSSSPYMRHHGAEYGEQAAAAGAAAVVEEESAAEEPSAAAAQPYAPEDPWAAAAAAAGGVAPEEDEDEDESKTPALRLGAAAAAASGGGSSPHSPGSPSIGFAARRAAKLANGGQSPRSPLARPLGSPSSPPVPPLSGSSSPRSPRKKNQAARDRAASQDAGADEATAAAIAAAATAAPAPSSSPGGQRAAATSNWSGEKPRAESERPPTRGEGEGNRTQHTPTAAADAAGGGGGDGSPRGGGGGGGSPGGGGRSPRLKNKQLSGLDLDMVFSTPSVEGGIDAARTRAHALTLPLGIALKRCAGSSASMAGSGGAVVCAVSAHGAAAAQASGWVRPGGPLLEVDGVDVQALPFDTVVLLLATRWRQCCRAAADAQAERGVAAVGAEAEAAAAGSPTGVIQRAMQHCAMGHNTTVLRLRVGARTMKQLPQEAGAATADSYPVTFGDGPLGLGLVWEAEQPMVPPVVEKVRLINAFAVASWRRGVVAPAQPAAARSLLCLLRSIAAFYLVLVRCRCPAF